MHRPTRYLLALVAIVAIAACSEAVAPEAIESPTAELSTSQDKACWGQASRVFAMARKMGVHSSSFAGEPRVGLANLARLLFEDGVLSEGTMQALGDFVATAEGYSIEACM